MTLVLSTDRFDTFAYFDPMTGHMELFKSDDSSPKINGHISSASGRQVCLYRLNDTLHLRVNEDDFTLTDNVKIDIKHVSQKVNRVSIFDSKRRIFQLEYPRAFDPTVFDPTQAQEEDFDVFLLAYNVLKDVERRRRIFL